MPFFFAIDTWLWRWNAKRCESQCFRRSTCFKHLVLCFVHCDVTGKHNFISTCAAFSLAGLTLLKYLEAYLRPLALCYCHFTSRHKQLSLRTLYKQYRTHHCYLMSLDLNKCKCSQTHSVISHQCVKINKKISKGFITQKFGRTCFLGLSI